MTFPKQRPLMTLTEVKTRLSIGQSTVYDLVKRGELPKPLKIGAAARWLPEDIERFLEERKAAR